MVEKNYSKREQDHFFGDLFKRMDKQDETLERIEAQTTKTNGRVNNLEWWKNGVIWLVGGIYVLLMASAAIGIPLLVQASKERKVELKNQIQAVLDDTLSQYDQIIINNKP